MTAPLEALCRVLEQITESLTRLTELEKQKLKAVRLDDLNLLNEIMNREQACALELKGLEQKRDKLMGEAGLAGVPLAKLAKAVPDGDAPRVETVTGGLLSAYGQYKVQSQAARTALENGLREIDQCLAGMGAAPAEKGPGYIPDTQPAPPKKMKTDFRC